MKTYLIIIIVLLQSCGVQTTKIAPPNNTQLLARALANNHSSIASLLKIVRLTENAQNIVQLNLMLVNTNFTRLNREINYLQQFYPQMSFVHQSILNEITTWVYINQIYHQEISPPVRILQREELYLAPSKIDFKKCIADNPDCANSLRKKLNTSIPKLNITKTLKKMALKDPCVNLSSTLQNEKKANRCLRKSKGDLKIELLSKPHFNTNEWLQAITATQ